MNAQPSTSRDSDVVEVIDVDAFDPNSFGGGIEYVGRKPVVVNLTGDIDYKALTQQLELDYEQYQAKKAKRKQRAQAQMKGKPLFVPGVPASSYQARASTKKTLKKSKRSRSQAGLSSKSSHTSQASPEVETIDLCNTDDDSDKETGSAPPSKRHRTVLLLDESDSEWEDIHSGFNIVKGDSWKPLPEVTEDEDTLNLENVSLDWEGRAGPSHDSICYPSLYDRDLKRGATHLHNPYPPPTWQSFSSSIILRPRRKNTLFDELKCSTLRETWISPPGSGSVNKITQNGQTIIACCSTVGGNYNADDDEPDPYNKNGSLRLIHDGQDIYLDDAHRSTRDKYYTVLDAKFDPHRADRFISSGEDRAVCLWTISSTGKQETRARLDMSHYFPDVPRDLHYQPSGSTLAIACDDGKLYVYPSTESFVSKDYFTFTVDSRSGHPTGYARWGIRSTAHMLYASSESPPDEYTGYHAAFDVDCQKLSYSFNATEGGDNLAIDNEGEVLALFTEASSSSRVLRLYDIRRCNGRSPTTTLELLPFDSPPPEASGIDQVVEVTAASFSPDSLFLAVARGDNVTHVYDRRMLDEPVHGFMHDDSDNKDKWGIVEVKWVETPNRRRLGLLTGGNDGCVRLWDTGLASDDLTNGRIVARALDNVGHFALGETRKSEKAMVIGDRGGRISTYEGVGFQYA